MTFAAVLIGALVWRYFGRGEALVMAGRLAGLAGLIALWWRRFDDSHVRANYLRMMRLGHAMTGGFLGFIGWQLVQGS
jgi:membrane associated rhomboid family serine protease